MPNYCANDNAQATGEHEVHTTECTYYSAIKSKTALGWFVDCEGAVKEAKKHYNNVDGCKFCSLKCHTR